MNKVYYVVLCCALLGGVAQILLKKGTGGSDLMAYFNVYLLGGLFLYGLSMIGYLYSLSKGDVSKIYPLIATSYIHVLILSSLFLKEPITGWKLIGGLGIVGSVWVMVK